MLINHKITNQKSNEFIILDIGHEIIREHKEVGPKIRFRYIIHFVIKGSILFKPNPDISYEVKENQAFLIRPNDSAYYASLEPNETEYYWIGLNGKIDDILSYIGFGDNEHILTLNNSSLIVNAFQKFYKSDRVDGIEENINFYNLVDCFRQSNDIRYGIKNENPQDLYIKKAIAYMEYSVNLKISIKEISNYLGIDRTYFSKLFKEKVGSTPNEYFSKLKVNKAMELLSTTKMSVASIAESLNYNDIFVFSKAFKRKTGLSPKEYRMHNEISHETD